MVYIIFYQHAIFLDLINIYIRNNKKDNSVSKHTNDFWVRDEWL
jgi:hypothetical protein